MGKRTRKVGDIRIFLGRVVDKSSRSTTSVIFRILYNHPTLSSVTDAAVIAEVKELIEAIAYAAFPGTHLVEFFPWMKYIPSSIAPWKRKAEDHSLRATKIFLELFRSVDVSRVGR